MTTVNGSPASPPLSSVSASDPSATVSLESINLVAGDDYTNRPYRIALTSANDLTGTRLIIAAKRNEVDAFAIYADIVGSVGSQYADFVPPSTESCDWYPAAHDGVLRIEHEAGKEETIWEGPVIVTAFPTPS